MTEPLVIEPRMQKDTWDCAPMCLSMLLGVPYAIILEQFDIKAARKRPGMTLTHIQRIASKLKKPLLWRAQVDDEDVGIISLGTVDGKRGHVAIYARDTIYNPANGEWWTDADAFYADGKWVVEGTLIRR